MSFSREGGQLGFVTKVIVTLACAAARRWSTPCASVELRAFEHAEAVLDLAQIGGVSRRESLGRCEFLLRLFELPLKCGDRLVLCFVLASVRVDSL